MSESVLRDVQRLRAELLPPGSEVWVRVYGSDGRELVPEPRCVRVPDDFAESGALPLRLRLKRFVRWVALWRTPTAGAGVHIDTAASAAGFVAVARMFEGIPDPGVDGEVDCRIERLDFGP